MVNVAVRALHATRKTAAGLASRVVTEIPTRKPVAIAPIFLLGCGRSGTTIVGRMIGSHRSVLYLNEPRYLWRVIDPHTDIWDGSPSRTQLAMGRSDADTDTSQRAARAFGRVLSMSRRDLLIEKLPINTFRIDYLRALFPSARFILLRRHGLEVAHSIAATSTWYTRARIDRWRQISALAVASGIEETFLRSCSDDTEKGLIEWTIATQRLGTLSDEGDPSVVVAELDFGSVISDPASALRPVVGSLLSSQQPDRRWERKLQSMISQTTQDVSTLVWPQRIHPVTQQQLERCGYSLPH